jgi:hypothetical protein
MKDLTIYVDLEGTSYISEGSDAVISNYENEARTITYTNLDDYSAWAKKVVIKNSRREVYTEVLDNNNSFKLLDGHLSEGKLLIQFYMYLNDTHIRDNTVMEFDVVGSLNNATEVEAGSTLGAAVQSHIADNSIHFPDAANDDVIYGRSNNDWVAIGGSTAVTSVNGETGAVVLDKNDIGLGNVDNTSDTNKPISSATQTALNSKASTSHTHTEASITDLDKYTQAQVNTLLLGKSDSTHNHNSSYADIAHNHSTTYAPLAHTSNTSNPHSVTKTQVGLGNVDNTSDADKPISTATSTALGGKADTSHTHTKSNISDFTHTHIEADITDLQDYSLTSHNHDAAYAPLSHATDTNNPHSVTKTQVGLGNVDNTSDVNKPVSTATQTALNAKAAIAGNETITGNWTFTGNADIYSNQLTSKTTSGDEYFRLCRVRVEGTNVYSRSKLNFNIVHTGTYVKFGMVQLYVYKISGNSSLHASSSISIINNSGTTFNFASGDVVYQNWVPSSGNIGFTDIYVKVQEYAKIHSTLDFGMFENNGSVTIAPDGATRISSIPATSSALTIESISCTAEAAVNATIKTITMT